MMVSWCEASCVFDVAEAWTLIISKAIPSHCEGWCCRIPPLECKRWGVFFVVSGSSRYRVEMMSVVKKRTESLRVTISRFMVFCLWVRRIARLNCFSDNVSGLSDYSRNASDCESNACEFHWRQPRTCIFSRDVKIRIDFECVLRHNMTLGWHCFLFPDGVTLADQSSACGVRWSSRPSTVSWVFLGFCVRKIK